MDRKEGKVEASRTGAIVANGHAQLLSPISSLVFTNALHPQDIPKLPSHPPSDSGVEILPQHTTATLVENGVVARGTIVKHNNNEQSMYKTCVPTLSAHQMALLVTPYKSRATYYQQSALHKNTKFQSQRTSEPHFSLWTAQNKLPSWAQRKHSDKAYVYMLMCVVIFMLLLAVCIPVAWMISK